MCLSPSQKEIKRQRRKRELAAIKESQKPSAEEMAKKAHEEEFWSDPCWSEPLDSTG